MLQTQTIRTGPFYVRLTTDIASLYDGITQLYSSILVNREEDFFDFHVKLMRPKSLRRWIRPQVSFLFDGKAPFKPLPLDQALPMFEWGLNWCISNHIHTHLISHAAVIEKDGKAVIMPGAPGSGKSTLCAGLMLSGYRLLTDELATIDPNDLLLTSLCRPVNLKNQSIELIKKAFPEAIFSKTVKDTAKGTVSLLKPSDLSFQECGDRAKAVAIVFPKYEKGEKCRLEKLDKGHAFMQLAEQSFNYSLLGERGFDILSRLIESCDCYSLSYGTLDESIAQIERVITDSAER